MHAMVGLTMRQADFDREMQSVMQLEPRRFQLAEPPVPADIIVAAEGMLGAVLPQQYKEFVRSYGAGEVAFTLVFSPRSDSAWSIVKVNQQLSIAPMIAFSDNQCGDLFGFGPTGDPTVHFFDHESGSWESTGLDFYSYFLKDSLSR